MEERFVVANVGHCTKCKSQVWSKYGHDYALCECGDSFIDGGLCSYTRYGGHMKPTPVYSDDSIETIRDFMYWGNNFTKEGVRLPRTNWLKLSEITDDHLQGILDYLPEEHKFLSIFKQELNYRNENRD